MLFNTVEFIIFFVFVLTIIVIIKNRKFQHIFLLGFSYFFFYFSSNYLITLLIFSTFLDYFVGNQIWKTNNKNKKKILLILSLAGNLSLLGFYKYSDFAIAQFNIFGTYFNLETQIPFLEIALPIGISFYTFQTISYTVDIYRGKLNPSKSFLEFALFVSFFPQLVAGPIVRAKDFLPQLREKISNFSEEHNLRLIIIQNSNLKMGITIMAFGFLKKMFFADNIAPLVDQIFSQPIGLDSFSVMLGAMAFGIQIYGDFSGYSDIAIGAALILGFKIPLNFNKPYFASSPSDFWSRWHISLSSWLKDYLYVPLGGNRKGTTRTYANLLTVMLLGGLWHGASWNFVIWGGLHGSYLIVHKYLQTFSNSKIQLFLKSKLGKIITIGITQYCVFLAWIPFRSTNSENALYLIQKYIILDFNLDGVSTLIAENRVIILLMILFMILHFISFKKINLMEKISQLPIKYWASVLAIILASVVFFYNGEPATFIYFRF